MKHIDLFSGIGGFALAVDRAFGLSEHVFVERDQFCQAILRKHWEGSTIYGDIRKFIADAERERRAGEPWETERQCGLCDREWGDKKPFILTGGFPCQPFSQAGRRKGTDDNRYLWPEMFRVIQLEKPKWIIAENVSGLATWNEGMVLETVCSDLEGEKYEVQPFIVPACAVGAPHRRDRIWIVANADDGRQRGEERNSIAKEDRIQAFNREKDSTAGEFERADCNGEALQSNSNTRCKHGEQRCAERLEASEKERETCAEADKRRGEHFWERDWKEVALATCYDGVDDGLSRRMGDTIISGSRWRKEALKAYGNAIVPQVVEMIMRAIAKAEGIDSGGQRVYSD